MRMLGSLFIVACLLATGCEWLKGGKKNDTVNPPPKDFGYGPPTPERLVGYLNAQADRLAVIESTDVFLVAHVQGKRMPGLTGFMVCEKPRNFRLTGDAVSTTYVDIGSNGEKFWFWVKDGESPLYYCSYNDYEKGVKLPLPFQPEWVVQALGMAKYDANRQYKVETKQGTYELIENTTVQGVPVRKITILNARNVTDASSPQVLGHVVQNAQTGATICKATIKHVRSATYRTVHGEERVSYPSDVVLEWPDQKLVMTMQIGKASVNQKLTGEQENRYFTLPNWQGIKSVDLARMAPSGNPTSRDVRQAGGFK
jgi:hypothetical protein